MREVMSTTVFWKVQHRLGQLTPSSLFLHMANRYVVKLLVTWEGEISMGGAQVHGSFEIFNSCGNWDFLLGKKLLMVFKAVHIYETDEVTVEGKVGQPL